MSSDQLGYRPLLIEALGNICKECKSGSDLEIDHIIPRSQNGLHKLENIQLLCIECHRVKTLKERTDKFKVISGNHCNLHIPNNLRARRTELKHRQKDVSDAVDLPRGTYSVFETGVMLPTLSLLDKLTDFLKCKDTDLYTDKILKVIESESVDV